MNSLVTTFAIMGTFGLAAVACASEVRTEQVQFNASQTGTTIKGRIVGYESVSYLLGAEAGQTMTVRLKPSNLATYFNIYEPGKGPGDQALANGSLTGPTMPDLNSFKSKLPTSGQYTISVYMMRSAAQRKERSDYTLDVSISALNGADRREPVRKDFADGLQGGPDFWDVRTKGRTASLRAQPSGAAPVVETVADGSALRNLGCRMAEGRRWCNVQAVDQEVMSGWIEGDILQESSYAGAPVSRGDALVPGTRFNATGNIPCARHAGQPMTSCRFGVVRGGDGAGEVTVFWPDGGSRVIVFKNSAPAAFQKSSADGDLRMDVARKADLFMIKIGPQRFEIPEAAITGG